MRNKDKGFTRIDVVVTIVCAGFLFVTLGAVGNRGRRRAQQLVCGSQLGKWGQAIFMQSADNDDMVMSMVRRWDPIPYPHYFAAVPLEMYSDPPADYMRMGEFSVYLIKPYLDCIGDDFENNGQGTRLLACPSTNRDFVKEWVWATWDAFCNPPGEGFIEPTYSYWNVGGPNPVEASSPGTSNGEGSENIMQDLTFDVLSPNRLLMSDVMNLDGGSPQFRYNHGVGGCCWNLYWYPDFLTYPRLVADGEQDATGRNQLFGDGRVEWRAISLEFEDNLPSEFVEGYLENEWNGPGSGWVNQWDVSWY